MATQPTELQRLSETRIPSPPQDNRRLPWSLTCEAGIHSQCGTHSGQTDRHGSTLGSQSHLYRRPARQRIPARQAQRVPGLARWNRRTSSGTGSTNPGYIPPHQHPDSRRDLMGEPRGPPSREPPTHNAPATRRPPLKREGVLGGLPSAAHQGRVVAELFGRLRKGPPRLQVGAGAYIPDRLGVGSHHGAFLGDLASVADGERKGLAIAIKQAPPNRKVCILSDSTTAIHTALQLSRGAPPKSGIETELKEAFLARQHDTAVAWIRGHLGLEGNTIADDKAGLHAHLGVTALQQRTATHEGLKAASNRIRKELRTQPGFGTRRTDWHRHALSAYTWYRTERGPQKAWLFQLRKVGDPSCPCGYPRQTGEHITFHCPRYNTMRTRLLGSRRSWAEIDLPVWRKEGDDSYDAIEAFFDFLYFEA